MIRIVKKLDLIMNRSGLIFPFNVIVALLGAAFACTLAAIFYIAVCDYALRNDMYYIKIAGLLWLVLGIGVGLYVTRLNHRYGVFNSLQVIFVALATAWMFLVANWAGWTWLQLEGNWFGPGFDAVVPHLMNYVLMMPQDWMATMSEFAQQATIDYEDLLEDGFTAERVYWMESGVLSICAALVIIITQRRF